MTKTMTNTEAPSRRRSERVRAQVAQGRYRVTETRVAEAILERLLPTAAGRAARG